MTGDLFTCCACGLSITAPNTEYGGRELARLKSAHNGCPYPTHSTAAQHVMSVGAPLPSWAAPPPPNEPARDAHWWPQAQQHPKLYGVPCWICGVRHQAAVGK